MTNEIKKTAREICEGHLHNQADTDATINDLVIDWSNDVNAEIDPDGSIYRNGRYATDEEIQAFIEWVAVQQ